jgi:hypothetical protein
VLRGSVIVLLLLVASSAAAQTSDPLDRARTHMEQGQAFYLQGRFDEAAAEFEAAYSAQPFSAFLFNAAVAYENAGHLAHAIMLFERYLMAEPHASDEDEVRARVAHLHERVTQRAAEAAASAESAVDTHEGAAPPEVAPTPAEIPTAESTPPPAALPQDFKSLVNIRTEPSGATVRIRTESGELLDQATSPMSHTLSAGRYHITIQHPSFNPAETDIEVEPGHVYMIVTNLSQGEFAGYLRVVSDPPGASVFVDDHTAGARGVTPFEGTARTGAHHLWIERAGYETIEADVDVPLGRDAETRVTLERTSIGRIRVIGNVSGARIFIDGRDVGAVPWEGEMQSGTHVLRVVADGSKPFERSIEITRGQLTPVRVRMQPSPGRGGAIAAGVVTALVLGGGITMTVLANEWANQLSDARARGTLAGDDPRIDQGFAFSIAQWGGYGLAAILLGVTLYYAFVDDGPPSEGTVLAPRDWAFAPTFDPTTGLAGLTAGGRF